MLGGSSRHPPPKKNLQSHQAAAKLCALNLFFVRDSELQIYHGKFLLVDNTNTGKYLSLSIQKGANYFMPRMHQNMFDDRDFKEDGMEERWEGKMNRINTVCKPESSFHQKSSFKFIG